MVTRFIRRWKWSLTALLFMWGTILFASQVWHENTWPETFVLGAAVTWTAIAVIADGWRRGVRR